MLDSKKIQCHPKIYSFLDMQKRMHRTFVNHSVQWFFARYLEFFHVFLPLEKIVLPILVKDHKYCLDQGKIRFSLKCIFRSIKLHLPVNFPILLFVPPPFRLSLSRQFSLPSFLVRKKILLSILYKGGANIVDFKCFWSKLLMTWKE